MKKEYWKPVLGYEGLYEVSTANVRHCCNGGYKDNKKKNGWHKATRCKNWIFKFHLMLDPVQF